MANPLVIRVASLLVTAAVWVSVDDQRSIFQWLTYSLGFVHYALSLRYSTRQILGATESPSQSLALLALSFFALSLYLGNFSLVAYFGLHHALNEAYRREPEQPRPSPRAAFFLQASAFAFALRRDSGFFGLDERVMTASLILATVVYVHVVRRDIGFASPARLAGACAAEMAAAMIALASLVVRIEFLHVVLYHFVLWSLLPLAQIRSRGRTSLAVYVGSSVLMTAGFFLISPIGPEATLVGPLRFTQLFLLLSYAHITLSFALSDAHPDWMIRIFRRDSVVEPAGASQYEASARPQR